jgi:biopolymer transport protein ExbD
MVRVRTDLSRRELDSDSTMTPMIDVVFQLLVFFVWTSGSATIEYMLPGQLSAPLGGEPAVVADPLPEQDFDEVVIRLRWDAGLPDWSINNQPMEDIAAVAATLQSLAQINSKAPIVIHPDPPVPLGFVIELFDEARVAGFSKVSFAVRRQ